MPACSQSQVCRQGQLSSVSEAQQQGSTLKFVGADLHRLAIAARPSDILAHRITLIGAQIRPRGFSIAARAMAQPQEQSKGKMFGGWNRQYKHKSETLGCDMVFTVFYPPAAEKGPVPVLYYLSGLTCTDQNVITKGYPQRMAAEKGIAFVAPDTSPRGLGIEGEDESYDFGTGAGFYVDATEPKWKQYRMYDYIVKELPALLGKLQNLDVDKAAICGHSMGGHGALVLGLRNPEQYRSISAFAPICNPMSVPWGQKALKGYLGEDKETWKQYDGSELAKAYKGPKRDILVDIGTGDSNLDGQLRPESLEQAVKGNSQLHLDIRMQPDYGHDYGFIATVMDEHIQFAAKHLSA